MLVARQIILKRNYYAMDYNVKLNLKKKKNEESSLHFLPLSNTETIKCNSTRSIKMLMLVNCFPA